MKPVVLNFQFRNVTSNCLVHPILAQIERWKLEIKIYLEPFDIFNNVGVYFYILMDILGIQHDLE